MLTMAFDSEGSGDLATGNGESEVKTFGAGFLTRHILQTQGREFLSLFLHSHAEVYVYPRNLHDCDPLVQVETFVKERNTLTTFVQIVHLVVQLVALLRTKCVCERMRKCADCPIEFSTINYTVVTSVCKVIQDHNMSEVNNQTVCCESFALLACPYADLLNNETLLCATDLFANLNYQGSYPGGIFQNCGDGNGVACPSTPPPNPNQTNATMDVPWTFFIILLSLMSLVNCHW